MNQWIRIRGAQDWGRNFARSSWRSELAEKKLAGA